MLKKTLLALLLLPFFYGTKAQVKGDFSTARHQSFEGFIVNDTIHRYQIGINTQFAVEGLFDDSVRTPIEIMIRRQTSLSSAVRIRIIGISKKFKREDMGNVNETHVSTLGMALGYEWQNILNRRWKWYYGAEVEGKFIWDNSVDELEVLDNNSSELMDQRRVIKRRTDQIALLPLVGLRFQISPYLFVSAEVKIEVLYEKFNYRRDNYWTWPDGSVAKSFSEFSIENSNINFQPYTGIFLNLIL